VEIFEDVGFAACQNKKVLSVGGEQVLGDCKADSPVEPVTRMVREAGFLLWWRRHVG